MDGCPIYEFDVALGSPVLPSEIRAEREQMEHLTALAAAANAA